ncbi:MAG: rod shape-determining protein [Ruminobacter sp.]|jgi:rod shape-determining protein MreB|uniref:Cell shape-determining protein MreB n=1 Tax=Ruminobacter amylophilus TaxID=867 RepID=A0A662ZIK8_9GAMM|nr:MULTISPECIES: rod shape-determining protein [Ruminobacter]MBQ3774691.1 rod shape-determining protein [Ruminobacter sp.]SFP13200.1 rod shape-determining protein MreB [Ruminobacter amylophilus]
MFNKLRSLYSTDLSIDLGTANTLIYVKSTGIVLNEPTVVAVKERGLSRGRPLTPIAVGNAAKRMLGKAPEDIKVVRPMKDGVIADCKYTERMLEEFMHAIPTKSLKFLRWISSGPRVLVCVPYGSTPVERNAIKNSIRVCGANEVHVLTEPMAAAVGAGLPVTEPSGSMVIDIGGGTTEVAIIALSGIVYASSVRTGGDKFDQAIVHYIRDKHRLEIGEVTAEKIKIEIGCAYEGEDDEPREMEIRGQSIIEQAPRSLVITSTEILEALQGPLSSIIDAVAMALNNAPPELSADISNRGMTITGGGALLRNIDKVLHMRTKVPVTIADDPLTCVARGGGAALEMADKGIVLFE